MLGLCICTCTSGLELGDGVALFLWFVFRQHNAPRAMVAQVREWGLRGGLRLLEGRGLVLKGMQVLNQHVRMRAQCRLLASALSGSNVLGQFTESGSNIAQNMMVF